MNKKSKNIRIISLFLSSLLCIVSLSGCYDNNEIENLAYVMAIGIDEGDSNSFNLTFQTAVPKSISGEGGGSGEATVVSSFKTDNFLSGIKKASEYLSRKINLSHTKIIVVSENIAKEGVTAFLNGLQNDMEIRPNVNIIVASEGAKNYIESIQPKLSANPAMYYDLLFRAYETDFLVPNTQLEDYLYRTKNFGVQPVAIYTGIDKTINESKSGDEEESKKKKPGDEEKKNMSIRGLAVFKLDKMVGKLDSQESTLFALLTGSNNSVNIDVIDPLDKRYKVLGNVMKGQSTTTKVTIKDGIPKIDITLKLNIGVQAYQSDNDYDEPDKAAKLKKAYEDYLSNGLKAMLSKATSQFKSDIFGFGEIAKGNFTTRHEWEQAKWPEIFPQSEYNLKVDISITRQG